MRRPHSRWYIVPFIFDDEGKKSKIYLKVPRGCKFLRNIKHSGKSKPTSIKGRKVIGWVNTYSAFDAINDVYSPIVMLRRNSFRPFKQTYGFLYNLKRLLFN